MASEQGRGAQVRLDDTARALARGGNALRLIDNVRQKLAAEVAGTAPSGNTADGSLGNGTAADDEVLLPGGAAGAFTFTPDGVGGLPRSIQDALGSRPRVVTDYVGVVPNNGSDCTAGLAACWNQGGDWYVPEGTYYIRGYGEQTDRGGVICTLGASIRITCHPNARFTSVGGPVLDETMIRFNALPNGGGLPDHSLDFEWFGGFLDISNSCVSISVPFLNVYPPPAGKLGASGATDAMALGPSYTVGSVLHGVLRRTYIANLTVYSGDHWETAGGDTGLGIGAGTGQTIVTGCRFIGSRDLGVYASGFHDPVLNPQDLVVHACRFDNCFSGVAVKRGYTKWRFTDNTFKGCQLAAGASSLVAPSNWGVVSGNAFEECTIFFRGTQCKGVLFYGNRISSIGAYLADGVTPYAPYGLTGFLFQGSSWNVIRDVDCDTISPGHSSATLVKFNDQVTAGVPEGSMYNYVEGAFSTDFGRVVEDTGLADYNMYVRCYNRGTAGLRDPLAAGAHTTFIRWNPTTNQLVYRSGFLAGDGSAAVPIIARSGQTDTGLWFGTSSLHVSTQGTDRLAVASAGITATVPITQATATSIVPAGNGDLVFERTSNTSLTLRLRGTDGVVRSAVLTLA